MLVRHELFKPYIDCAVTLAPFLLLFFHIELMCFLHELDKRVADAQKELKKHVPERKDRNIGSLLATFPPSDVPKWTVDKEWLKGMLCIIIAEI